MGRLVAFLLLILIAGASYFWWSSSSREGQMVEETISERGQDTETASPSGSSKTEQDQGELPREGAITVEAPEPEVAPDFRPPPSLWSDHKKDTATSEEKKFVTNAQQWTQQLRILIEHFSLQLLIEQGAPLEAVLGKGAEPLDLHAEYAAFSQATASLDLPQTCEEAAPLVQESTDGMKNIMSTLSNPPTLEELEAAVPPARQLQLQLNDLYRVMNNYCQS